MGTSYKGIVECWFEATDRRGAYWGDVATVEFMKNYELAAALHDTVADARDWICGPWPKSDLSGESERVREKDYGTPGSTWVTADELEAALKIAEPTEAHVYVRGILAFMRTIEPEFSKVRLMVYGV